MKYLEENIKERLDGYESPLPEGSLNEFRDRLEASRNAERVSGKPQSIWFVVPAVAAVLALFLLSGSLHDKNEIRISNGGDLVAQVADTTGNCLEETVVAYPCGRGTSSCQRRGVITDDDSAVKGSEGCVIFSEMDSAENSDSQSVESIDSTASPSQNGPVVKDACSSPYIPEDMHSKNSNIGIKVAIATGATGGIAAITAATIIPSLGNKHSSEDNHKISATVDSSAVIGTTKRTAPADGRKADGSHSMPFKTGASLRIPLGDRLSLTTGLEYSKYSSSFDYTLSGTQHQNAHYLGIPLRLDYTFHGSRWFDLYAGAGVSADFCLAADLDGRNIPKDGITVSLLGTIGAQFNITDHLGVFIEPDLSWSIPSENRILETYRTEYPFMFSMAFGVRITLRGST